MVPIKALCFFVQWWIEIHHFANAFLSPHPEPLPSIATAAVPSSSEYFEDA
jgi:hypothetical protein